MPNKTVISNFNTIEEDHALIYEARSISKSLKNFFLNLAESLLIKLQNPLDKYNLFLKDGANIVAKPICAVQFLREPSQMLVKLQNWSLFNK